MDFYDPKQFEVKLELNQEPTVASSDFLELNLGVSCEMSRNVIRLLELILIKVRGLLFAHPLDQYPGVRREEKETTWFYEDNKEFCI